MESEKIRVLGLSAFVLTVLIDHNLIDHTNLSQGIPVVLSYLLSVGVMAYGTILHHRQQV